MLSAQEEKTLTPCDMTNSGSHLSKEPMFNRTNRGGRQTNKRTSWHRKIERLISFKNMRSVLRIGHQV